MIMTDHATQNRQALIGKRRSLWERIKTALIVLALLAAWATVSEMDYREAVSVAQSRCIYRGI